MSAKDFSKKTCAARGMANGGYMASGEVGDMLQVEEDMKARSAAARRPQSTPAPSPAQSPATTKAADEPEIPAADRRESVGKMEGLEVDAPRPPRASDNYGDRDNEVKPKAQRKASLARRTAQASPPARIAATQATARHAEPNSDPAPAPMKRSSLGNISYKPAADAPSIYAKPAEWAAYRAKQAGATGMANGGFVAPNQANGDNAQGGGRKSYAK